MPLDPFEWKGHSIRYNQNSGTWTCSELGFDAPQLSGLQDKINAWLLKQRKREGTPAIVVSKENAMFQWATPRPCEVTALEISTEYAIQNFGHTVSINVVDEHGRPRREKVRAKNLVPDTPEVHEALAQIEALAAAVQAARQKVAEAVEALPAFDINFLFPE